jgi:hypothetical protein
MRIALLHNLPSGGARRHTLEQVRELSKRGHQIAEFAPQTADEQFCSFAPHVQEQTFYAGPMPRGWQGRIPLITPYLHAVEGIDSLRRQERLERQIALDVDNREFDLVFAKDCQIIGNPYALR